MSTMMLNNDVWIAADNWEEDCWGREGFIVAGGDVALSGCLIR